MSTATETTPKPGRASVPANRTPAEMLDWHVKFATAAARECISDRRQYDMPAGARAKAAEIAKAAESPEAAERPLMDWFVDAVPGGTFGSDQLPDNNGLCHLLSAALHLIDWAQLASELRSGELVAGE